MNFKLALGELPKNQSDMFVLNEIEDFTLQEIADLKGENLKTIISRKGYAVKHLRSRLNFHQAQMPYFRGVYRRPKYNVPVNISETETAFEVQVYATGFDKEHITISVIDDVLLIIGQNELENAPKFT